MKLNSRYFDSIRVATRKTRDDAVQAGPACQWKGCEKRGSHRAPKGRGRDGEYYVFCVDHVRQYNASYNYFDGMSDGDIVDFQKDAVTGHRPTWRVGGNSAASRGKAGAASTSGAWNAHSRMQDPHGFFAWRARKAREEAPKKRREVRPLERKALEALHLSACATRTEIKARFKELAKRHHPDTNGGDKRSEEKLREIIQAYNYLKQSGLA